MSGPAMIPRRAALAIVTTFAALALLVTFDASARAGVATTVVSGAGGGGTGGSSAAVGSPVSVGSTGSLTSGSPGSSSTASAGSRTVTGPVVPTQHGNVQVAITVQGTKIVDVVALQLPAGARSATLSQSAAAVLRQEVLAAQSSNVNTVSGATYTSVGYLQSLQAAINQAGI